MFFSALPVRRWTAAVRMLPHAAADSAPPTAGGPESGPQRQTLLPTAMNWEALADQGGPRESATRPPAQWPKVTSGQALRCISLKAKRAQGVGGPLNHDKVAPTQGPMQQGATIETGPTPTNATILGPHQVVHRQAFTTKEHGPCIDDVTANENGPMSILTSGPRLHSAKGGTSESEDFSPSKGAARGSGSTGSGSRADFPIIRTEGAVRESMIQDTTARLWHVS